jgi:hypothetical protein
MNVTLITVAIALVFAIFYGYRQYKRAAIRKRFAQNQTKFENSKYRCAIIETGLFTCRAVKKIANQPILLDYAPVLPLPTCDISQCDCKYIRRNDRRQDERRTPYPTMANTVSSATENRSYSDRRKSPATTR